MPEVRSTRAIVLGVASGAAAALCWSLGFIAARQGITLGMSPYAIALHRYLWPGLALLPYLLSHHPADLGGIGWRRGILLALFGGLPLGLLAYIGYWFVPLGHGAVIQPSCAALGGLVLARFVLHEPLPTRRIVGAVAMIVGVFCIGTEAVRTMGGQGIGGDLLFVAAGAFFAVFGMLVRLWRVAALDALAVTSVLSLVGVPIGLFTYRNILDAGLFENVLQAVVQGALTGAAGTYLFTRAVSLLGASRALVFPSLVPPFTLLGGFLALGEVPTAAQLAGLVIVVVGFQLTQRS